MKHFHIKKTLGDNPTKEERMEVARKIMEEHKELLARLAKS